MKIFLAQLVCYGLLLTGCCWPRLHVETQYINRESLASFYVETPDPLESCPNLGERVIINWNLPEEYLEYEDLHVELTMRLRNQEMRMFSYPLCSRIGTTFYYLLNADYFNSRGILTYKVDLIGDGELLEAWRHQLWTELIVFDGEK